MRYPHFAVYLDRAGLYRWRLVAANGEIVAVSEAYVSRQGAVNGAYTVKQLVPQSNVYNV